MKRTLLSLLATLVLCGTSVAAQRPYQTVEGDPLKTRIYTLDNGLTVYMSVNKESPRIQTYIAVRVGGKNDPAQTTGLAHYFEHLMFKGTSSFGTQNYAKEKPLLDEIERQFEIYRTLTDSASRKATYKIIDSLSNEASKYAIPNEYDKLMASIGAQGTNAWTSYDETNYTEDIPANQIENWAKIQANRFSDNVIRGFHTELETVYEEKNMSLTNDFRKVYEAMSSALCKKHPYGSQTVLGTQDHLKNPSIINIKNYYKKWYVPNNMAICMAGDFDPDTTIELLDKYFGKLYPSKDLQKMHFEAEDPMLKPIEVEVWGLEAENITIGYRLGGARTDDAMIMLLVDGLMNNGMAGLIDLNITQKQLMGSAGTWPVTMSDYSVFALNGVPKEGQTLDEARAILLSQVEALKKGEFDQKLLSAVINNYRRQEIQKQEYNSARAYSMMRSFIDDVEWKKSVQSLDRMSKITKEQVVAFANANFGDNYAVIYKRQGKDPNEKKIDKPTITPIQTNRDQTSQFLSDIQASTVKPIEPQFLDYNRDMQRMLTKSKAEVLYKKNELNGLFTMTYVFDMGRNSDKKLPIAALYADYVGTSKYTPEEIKTKFYEMACSFYVYVGNDIIHIGVNGLAENQAAAIALLEEILLDAKADEGSFDKLKTNIIKERNDAKKSQRSCFGALQQYVRWGANGPHTNVLTDDELQALTAKEIVDILKGITAYQHSVLYYGTQESKEFLSQLNLLHKTPKTLRPVIKNTQYAEVITDTNRIFIAPYDAAQIYYIQYNNRGDKFDPARAAVTSLYNDYFGGGMNSIVFQEMREARGLAYSAQAGMGVPRDLSKNYVMTAFIATQNDKMAQAMEAFAQIINDMPTSEQSFNIAKTNALSVLRTNRIQKEDIMHDYLAAKKLGLDYDQRKMLFEGIEKLTLDDVKKFQQQYVKDGKWNYAILGRIADLDQETLKKYGEIIPLTLQDIFGY